MKEILGGERDVGTRRLQGRRLRAVLLTFLLLAALAVPAVGQPGPVWPDGEWVGTISGAGSASGTLDGQSGAGSAVASGGFAFEIVEGETTGGYGVSRHIRHVEFAYDDSYAGEPVGSTLPVRSDPYTAPAGQLPAFFVGLLPEMLIQ